MHAQRILKLGPPYKIAYGNHPQMERFKSRFDKMEAIGHYLRVIRLEGRRRGYNFNNKLIIKPTWGVYPAIPVPQGQVIHEFKLLLRKLELRDKAAFYKLLDEMKRYSLGYRGGFPPYCTYYPEINTAFYKEDRDKQIATWETVKEITI